MPDHNYTMLLWLFVTVFWDESLMLSVDLVLYVVTFLELPPAHLTTFVMIRGSDNGWMDIWSNRIGHGLMSHSV